MKNLDKYSAHDFSSENKVSIDKSKKCGCYYCLETFAPHEIIEWIYEWSDEIGTSALCPKCGIDSVLPDFDVNINEKLLTDMQLHWFGEECLNINKPLQ